jgi:hypothetical protein
VTGQRAALEDRMVERHIRQNNEEIQEKGQRTSTKDRIVARYKGQDSEEAQETG